MKHPGRFTTGNQPTRYGRNVRGPMPSSVSTACAHCGKVRWLHPTSIAASSGLCASCARRKPRKKPMTKNQVTLRDRLRIASFIEKNMVPDGDKYAKYVNGVQDDNDAAIKLTELLGRTVTLGNVMATRKSLNRKLRNPGKSPEELAAMRAKITAKRGPKPRGPYSTTNAQIIAAVEALRDEIHALRRALGQPWDDSTYRSNGPHRPAA